MFMNEPEGFLKEKIQGNALLEFFISLINKTIQAGNKKYIVSYSGGIGSAITAQMVVDKYGAENTVLLFSDTNMEDPDLYRFNKDVSNLLQVPITRIADGRTPWEVFEDVKFIGNSRIDPCSQILKREIIKTWIKENYTSEECNIFVGIDCSEEHRLHRVVEANKPYVYRSILIEQDIFIDNEYKLQWCKDNNITPPLLYALGFAHNNCGGFCVKAGLGQFKMLYEKLPERYNEHEEIEQRLMRENPKLRPFLKKTIKGETLYLTMKDYREQFLEKAKTEEDKFDFGGCGCALED